MASTQSRDPRLNNANKRPPSRSPEGRLASNKRQATKSTALSALTNRGSASNDENRVGSPGSVKLADNPSPTVALEKFFDASISAAVLRVELQSAETERQRVDREYSLLKDKFSEFPAIKAQKTAARTRAQQEVERIERKINDQAPEQKKILNTLASLFNQSATTTTAPQSAPSISDGPSPLELQSDISKLKAKVAALEAVTIKKSDLDTSEVSKKLEQLEKTASEASQELPRLRASLHSLETQVAQLKTTLPKELASRLPAVEAESARNSKTIVPLQGSLQTLGSKVDQLATELSQNVKSRILTVEAESSETTKAITPLKQRIGALETLPRAAASRSQQPEESPNTEQLHALSIRVKQLEDDSEDDKAQIISHVDGEITDLRDEVTKKLADAKETMKREIDDDLGASQDRLRKTIDEGITTVQRQLAEVKSLLAQHTTSIGNCMERLLRCEGSHNSRLSTEELGSLRKLVMELQEKLAKVENERDPRAQTVATRTPVWQAVLPSNDEDEMHPQTNGIPPAATDPDLVTRLGRDIEMLKGVAARHERLYNNLTTDEIVKQMVDQMSAMYPDAKNFQVVASTLQAEIKSTQETLSTVHEAVERTVKSMAEITKHIPNLQEQLEQDANALREDISSIKLRVEECAKTLEQGKIKLAEIEELETDVKAMTPAVRSLTKAVEKIPLLEEQIQKLQDASRNRPAKS
ncbi:Intracellular protein transport protein USO1 [Cercospora beticola]|uniref:Intracellular protein transport protein USO1 n=1 Tax=Cercospora beticola TaxID=122368 RepID=A0A2G5I4S7_CERBT|nr:Intracellular protein transport protein USO1 [Cercospora beticola]PIA99780.1 Intracellular protein transport protein USO1 [Cercospora beticola]WPA99954.1 hypothetical protein RHO25_004574 [Cercospora beticola]CAK1361868.1 unnamed protein product [Cercospora beticola]